MLFRLTLVGSIACFALSSASAREIVVNNILGDDVLVSNDDDSASDIGPVRTIKRALELARPGDRVVVTSTGTPYREQLTIGGCHLRGSLTQPFVITSDGAVLDGTVEAAAGAWQHLAGDVFAMRPRRLTYQQVFRSGKPLSRTRLASHLDADQTLMPLEWALAGGAILLRTEEDRLPRSYELRHAGLQTGITLYNTRNVLIEGLVIQGFQQDGVNAHELVQDCTLRNVESRANGRSGLGVSGASRVQAEGCNFYDNGRSQVRLGRIGRLTLEGCDVEGSPDAPAYQGAGSRLVVDGEATVELR